MAKYRVPFLVDPRAALTRHQMRHMQARDLCDGTMRLALHLSQEEEMALEALNPDTLGHPDTDVRTAYWADFIGRPESVEYRVNQV